MLSSVSIDIAILNALSNSSLNCGASPSIAFCKFLINSNSNSLATLAMSTPLSSSSTSSAKSFAALLAFLLITSKGFFSKNLLYSLCISKPSSDKEFNKSCASVNCLNSFDTLAKFDSKSLYNFISERLN